MGPYKNLVILLVIIVVLAIAYSVAVEIYQSLIRRLDADHEAKQREIRERKAEEARARIERLVAFAAEQLRKSGRRGLQSPDQTIIRGEFVRARARQWDFPVLGLPAEHYKRCWQQTIEGDEEGYGREMSVVITPAGRWAVMGTETTHVITRGERYLIDGVPWLVSSEGIGLNGYQLRVLVGGIEALLARHRPAAVAEFRTLWKESGT